MSKILTGPLHRALIVEDPDPSLDQHLREAGIEPIRVSGGPDEEALIELLRLHRPQVLCKRSRVQVTRRVLEACPELVAVQLCCIGDDSVDKLACAQHGVLVFNDPVSNGRSVVELAIGQLISLSRRLYESDALARAAVWGKDSSERYEVHGKFLGILGLGNIGRSLGRAAEALGMQIRFFDVRQVAQEVGTEMGWELCDSPAQLFRSSDYISLHVSADDPWGGSNSGMVGSELLQQLGADRPDSSPRILLNLARGNLIEPADLLGAIESGAIRRAAVDVFPSEPHSKGDPWPDNPYAAERRVAITPHIGAATREAQPRIAHRVAKTLAAFSKDGAIRDCIFSPRARFTFSDAPPGGAIVTVIHSTTRGTKKALDDAIYEAGASNLRSQHQDFDRWGIAVDINLLDRPLPMEALEQLAGRTQQLTGDPDAVRRVRQVVRTS